MKYKAGMLVVSDLERSREFYKTVLGLRVVADFGANITLTGGFSLQTQESWEEFISVDSSAISYGGNNFELYFEEDDLDGFVEKLNKWNVPLVHPMYEASWGQRSIRFYDPDRHIIEVGENMKVVCKRFLDSGMTVPEVAKRMDVAEKHIRVWMR